LKESISMAEELGNREGVTLALDELGALMLEQHDYTNARACFAQSLIQRRDLGARAAIARSLDCFAALAEARGQAGRALRLMQASNALRSAIGVTTRSAWQAGRGPAAPARRPSKGRPSQAASVMSFDDAVAYALELGPEPRRQSGTASPLTRREHEVAALIAQGHSNRQLAQDLVISERTAEHHVENILAKLGLDSRTQIGVWAVQHGVVLTHRTSEHPHA
jgi:non-specific serine/threonine protein kinase